jgi:F-type H+-transporting ATPase subunit alpha
MTAPTGILQPAIERAFSELHRGREAFTPQLRLHEVGIVTKVSTGIATLSGLPGVGYEEIVTFPGDLPGIAFNIDEDEVGVIRTAGLASNSRAVKRPSPSPRISA